METLPMADRGAQRTVWVNFDGSGEVQISSSRRFGSGGFGSGLGKGF